MNATNNYLFKYITLSNYILFEKQGVTKSQVTLAMLAGFTGNTTQIGG
jgi:hypothetical protein